MGMMVNDLDDGVVVVWGIGFCLGAFLWPLLGGSSPCAFSGAQGCLRLLAFGYDAIVRDLGGRVVGPVGTGPLLSVGPCTRASAPSLSIASSLAGAFARPRWIPAFAGMTKAAGTTGVEGRGRPRRGVRCCAERCVRPLATLSSRGTRRQTACLVGPYEPLSRCSLPPVMGRSRRLSAPRAVSRPLARASPARRRE